MEAVPPTAEIIRDASSLGTPNQKIKMADPQADMVQSPIIMKVDSPEEDNDKEDKKPSENSEVDINPSQVCSPTQVCSVIGNVFSHRKNTVLRPSLLGQPSKGFTLNPSKLNPFAKTSSAAVSDDAVCNKNVNGDAPKFVPLIVSDKPKEIIIKPVTNSIPKTTSNHTFVFGQNLQDRVVGEPHNDEPKPSTSVATNGSQDDDSMLFSSAAKENAPTSSSDLATPCKSLSESAREYEEQRANKRKYEEVEVKTGEEDETNILHISCKLFSFDKAVGNWQERGRGNLRLNVQTIEEDGNAYVQSRLVFRTAGVLRVILNTKIWAEMTIEQSSAKSIRFTALDNSGEIKVFLVMANPDEIKYLYKCLQERLIGEQKRQNLKRVNNNRGDGETSSSEAGIE